MSVIGSNILAGASGAAGAAAYEIERSLRFDSGSSAYLSKTPSAAGNRKTFTFSAWLKKTTAGGSARNALFNAGTNISGNSGFFGIRFQTADTLNVTTGSTNLITTTRVFRDVSAWYHIVVTGDTTLSSNQFKIYVNGVLDTQGGSLTVNTDLAVGNNVVHEIGRTTWSTNEYLNGYLADVHFIDGQALAATDFGSYDDNNVWQPKEYTGTFGTNGFKLDFSDNTNTTTIAEDSSGNNNDFTANNISVTAGYGNDSMIDSPTDYEADSGNNGGNYATFNALQVRENATFSNGNLQVTSTVYYRNGVSTLGMDSGKFYFEGEIITNSTNGYSMIGVTDQPEYNNYPGSGVDGNGFGWYSPSGTLYYDSGTQETYSSYTVGDIVSVAYDAATRKSWIAKNGTWQNSGDPAAGTGHVHTVAGTKKVFFSFATGANGVVTANFGQRPFEYTPPTGFKSLCTKNLADPTIEVGSTAMDVLTWSGDDATRTLSGLNFTNTVGLAWVKNRSSAVNHVLQDVVRGFTTGKKLSTNLTDAEGSSGNLGDSYGYISGASSTGFTISKDGSGQDWVQMNQSSNSYVGWTWDAGTSTVSNTDGSITSSVRANTSAGFSVLTAPVDSSGGTIGHGLNASPSLIIGKNRDSGSSNWGVWHSSLGTSQYLLLNSTAAVATSSTIYNGVSSTTFTVGSGWSTSSASHVFYCWAAAVEGYSAFGSYTGNGSSDGPFVDTGFRPRWLLWKRSDDTGHWVLYDTARAEYNVASNYLRPNLSNAEISEPLVDILSNGFKIRVGSAYTATNVSGSTYVWAAFAENPIKTARAR